MPGGEAGISDETGAQQIGGRDGRAGRVQTELREAFKDDIGEKCEIVEDEGEEPDIENLLDEGSDDVVFRPHRPEDPGEDDIDADQERRQIGDVGTK